MPAITARPALVPWAEEGMRQTSRSRLAPDVVVGADGQQAGQLALAAGVGLQRDGVVAGDVGPAPASRRVDQLGDTRQACSAGANGCMSANSGQVTGSISVVAFSFMVQLPSGIMRPVQRQVGVGQAAQVAQHLGLGPVRGGRWGG